MSRRNRHFLKSGKLETPTFIPVLAALGIVGVVVIVVLIIANILSATNAVLKFEAQVKGAPRLAVERDIIDHGNLPLGSSIETTFVVRNIGDKELDILGNPIVEVVEGCCPPTAQVSSSILAPGQTATITMRYSMHDSMGGKHRFNVHLRTNDPQEPEKILVVYSNWV
jgi:hypothetical protein